MGLAAPSGVNPLHPRRVASYLPTLASILLPALGVVVACGGSSDGVTPPLADMDGGAGDAADIDGAAPADGGGCRSSVQPGPGVIVTDKGAVRGALESGAYAYRNIPFAAPPTGALRWRPPAAAECWNDVRDGAAWGPMCPQVAEDGTGPVTGTEDCLQLNVFAPANKPGPLPIMLWIHGGGHVSGSAASETGGIRIYDGGALAAKEGVIVVSTNYRLGALGFLAHPKLAAEDPNHSEGNYGTLDLIAALQWVKANAAAIGGDAARVTIFGESAGAVNVCALVVSPLAKGLFVGGVMESGACVAKERADAETFSAKVFAATKCDAAADPLACMRALTSDALTVALPVKTNIAGATGGYGNVNDGYVITGKPIDVIKAGGHSKVAMIVGSNADETSRSVPIAPTATDAQYQAAVRTLFAGAAEPVLAQYPSAEYPSPWKAYIALTTDAKFGCQARKAARAFAQFSAPIYRYYFSHALDNGMPALRALGAWHGVDVLYIFNHLNVSGYVAGPGDQMVADAMMHRWASFARSPTDPNVDQQPAWSPYAAATDPYLELASPVGSGQGLRTTQCDFWDTVAP